MWSYRERPYRASGSEGWRTADLSTVASSRTSLRFCNTGSGYSLEFMGSTRSRLSRSAREPMKRVWFDARAVRSRRGVPRSRRRHAARVARRRVPHLGVPAGPSRCSRLQTAGEVFRADAPASAPRLISVGLAGPAVQGDFNATTDRGRFMLRSASDDGLWPVLSGAAFKSGSPRPARCSPGPIPTPVIACASREARQPAATRQRRRSRSSARVGPRTDDAPVPAPADRVPRRHEPDQHSEPSIPACSRPAYASSPMQRPISSGRSGIERRPGVPARRAQLDPSRLVRPARRRDPCQLPRAERVPNPGRPTRRPPRARVVEIAGSARRGRRPFRVWAAAVGVPVGVCHRRRAAGPRRRARRSRLSPLRPVA